MRKPAAVVISLTWLGLGGCSAPEQKVDAEPAKLSLSVVNESDELASVPLAGNSFAVGYRNSLYGTWAEERYTVARDGSYVLVQIAADQLAVLEEYYGLPTTPKAAHPSDRRNWIADPDPARPARFTNLSLAATQLGQRTVFVPGSDPIALWTLVDNDRPFVVITLKETP
jgi:hypothetical protein